MEACGFNGAAKFDDEQGLMVLLDAFSASFSIEEIASAYCKAGKNAEAAAESLATTAGEESSGVVTEKKTKTTSDNANGKRGGSKIKYRPVSMGSVSDVIGKQYGNKTTSGSNKAVRVDPPKSKVLPIPESWA